MPSECVFFDTETKPEQVDEKTQVHRLWFGWAAYTRRTGRDRWTKPDWFRFTSKRQFWKWVNRKTRDRTRLYLFCHNTSFDLPVLDVFHEMPRFGWKLVSAIIDAPPTILHYRKGKRTLVFLDTLNYWRMPLAKVGEMVGSRKLEMPQPEAPAEAWDEYAKQDVQVLIDAVTGWVRFLTDHDFGGFAPTLAGQSMRTYRHRFMPSRILVHDRAEALRLERESYHGGRVEPFFVGRYEKPVYKLDINSMYPAVMASGMFPARFAYHHTNPRAAVIHAALAEYSSIARVQIHTDTPLYPVRHAGKLIFPVGRFPAVLAGPELIEAFGRGHIEIVREIAVYEPEPLFAGFVETLYGLRLDAKQAGHAVRAGQFKLLMNSLYGKFGQSGKVWEHVADIDDLSARAWLDVNVDTGERTSYRQLGGIVQEASKETESRDSAPAIASYVTSYARVLLWRLIEMAGRANVLYVDTDSLFVNGDGNCRLSKFRDEVQIGRLKLEQIAPAVEIFGPKDYTFGGHKKLKGVRRDAVWVSPHEVEQIQWQGLRSQVRQGQETGPRTRIVRKRLSRTYTKAHVLPSGWTEPLRLELELAGDSVVGLVPPARLPR